MVSIAVRIPDSQFLCPGFLRDLLHVPAVPAVLLALPGQHLLPPGEHQEEDQAVGADPHHRPRGKLERSVASAQSRSGEASMRRVCSHTGRSGAVEQNRIVFPDNSDIEVLEGNSQAGGGTYYTNYTKYIQHPIQSNTLVDIADDFFFFLLCFISGHVAFESCLIDGEPSLTCFAEILLVFSLGIVVLQACAGLFLISLHVRAVMQLRQISSLTSLRTGGPATAGSGSAQIPPGV